MIDKDGCSIQAQEVMGHLRALRQELLSGGAEPVGDRERSGLTGPQVSVLTHLVLGGPATVTDLAGQLHLSHSTMSGIVDRLEARGLVCRVRDERDRRCTRISVTGIVEDYVRELDEGPFGRLAAALGRATPAQRRAVLEGLALLRELLSTDARP